MTAHTPRAQTRPAQTRAAQTPPSRAPAARPSPPAPPAPETPRHQRTWAPRWAPGPSSVPRATSYRPRTTLDQGGPHHERHHLEGSTGPAPGGPDLDHAPAHPHNQRRPARPGAGFVEYAGLMILIAGIFTLIDQLGLDGKISKAIGDAVNDVIGG